MGTPAFAAHCLERLLASPHWIAAVVTRPDKPRGRGMELQPSAVKTLALERGIEVLAPASAKDPALMERLHALAPDLVVVVAYGRILPPAVLGIPRLGCINAHASLLPKLRGAAPIERAILQEMSQTGVTIMRINERLDAGDMLMSRTVPIRHDTDAGDLRETLARTAADLLVAAIDALASGNAHSIEQDEAQATYAPPLERDEAQIAWNETSPRVGCRVRAFAPRPGAFTTAGARRLKVLRGTPLAEHCTQAPGTILGARGDAVAVACGTGVYLLEVVQPEGKRHMAAADWLRGSGAPSVLGSHA